jgi:endogenous inhibitor of DNA gyrase (YacG/DUF329 family)
VCPHCGEEVKVSEEVTQWPVTSGEPKTEH